jgi:hypothetical protein
MRQDQFIAEVRAAAKAIWDANQQLKALQAEAGALDYGTTLVVPDGGPTRSDILAVAYDTNDALTALLATGHATNLAKLL